jgi:hypothetical protein
MLQPRCYGSAHAETECLVPLDLSGLAVRNICLVFVRLIFVVAHFAIRGLVAALVRCSAARAVNLSLCQEWF